MHAIINHLTADCFRKFSAHTHTHTNISKTLNSKARIHSPGAVVIYSALMDSIHRKWRAVLDAREKFSIYIHIIRESLNYSRTHIHTHIYSPASFLFCCSSSSSSLSTAELARFVGFEESSKSILKWREHDVKVLTYILALGIIYSRRYKTGYDGGICVGVWFACITRWIGTLISFVC